MTFIIKQKILFRHCDPAGIVFFPRYYEMINDSIEAYFDEILDLPFDAIHKTGAVPTVSIETVFPAPSRHGDILEISVKPIHMGNSSLQLEVKGSCENELRFKSKSTLVLVDNDGKPLRWQSVTRKKISDISGENYDT